MDALLRRRAMIGAGPIVLPYDPADYIETNGLAYLNTGIAQVTRNIELKVKFAWIGNDASLFESFVAYMENGGTTPRSGLHKYNGNWMYGTNVTNATSVPVDGNVHEFLISGNATTQKETLSVDGTIIGTATTTSTDISGNAITFFLGCRNRNGSVDNNCYARFYSLNYKKFGDASHSNLQAEVNMIPVRYNGVFGMWDTLSQTFKSSISGTDFTGQLTQQ